MSRRLAVVAGLVLATMACSGDPGAAPTDSEPTTVAASESSPSPSVSPTATASEDPFAVPDTIDEAYVEEVIGGLDPVWSQMLQAFVDSGSLDDPERVELSLAVMTGPEAAEFAQQWSDLLEDVPDALENVRDPVGLPTTTVEAVVRADDACIVAKVERTHEDVYVEDDPAAGMQGWVVLERVPEEGPEAEYAAAHNPTPWRYAVVDTYTQSEEPDDSWC